MTMTSEHLPFPRRMLGRFRRAGDGTDLLLRCDAPADHHVRRLTSLLPWLRPFCRLWTRCVEVHDHVWTTQEAADMLGISRPTLVRCWRPARSRLRRSDGIVACSH